MHYTLWKVNQSPVENRDLTQVECSLGPRWEWLLRRMTGAGLPSDTPLFVFYGLLYWESVGTSGSTAVLCVTLRTPGAPLGYLYKYRGTVKSLPLGQRLWYEPQPDSL